jgi:hypothetical protein
MPKPSTLKRDAPESVRFSQDERRLRTMIQAHAKAASRSFSGELKHLAKIALVAQDNPDLPVSMIEDLLAAQSESEAGLGEPYRWGVLGG